MKTLLKTLFYGFTNLINAFIKPNSHTTDPQAKKDNGNEQWENEGSYLGSTGQSLEPLNQKIDAAKEEEALNNTTHFDKNIADEKNEVATITQKVNKGEVEFIKEAELKMQPQLDAKNRDLDVKYANNEEKTRRKTIKIQDGKREVDDEIRKLRHEPKEKKLIEKATVRAIIIVLLFGLECPNVFSALQSYGFAENYLVVSLTITFSALVAFSCEFTGKFLAERRRNLAIATVLTGLTVSFIIIGIRINSPEPAPLANEAIYSSVEQTSTSFDAVPLENEPEITTTSFKSIDTALNILTLVLYALGLTLAYLSHRHKPFFEKKSNLDKDIEERDRLLQQKEEKPKAYADVKREHEAKCRTQGKAEYEQLKSQLDSKQNHLQQLEIEKQHSLKSIEHKYKSIRAAVKAAYEEGKRQAI